MLNIYEFVTVVSSGALLAAVIGGMSMGVYYAAIYDFRSKGGVVRGWVNAMVLGLSFIVPIWIVREIEGSIHADATLPTAALWFVFVTASVLTNWAVTRKL